MASLIGCWLSLERWDVWRHFRRARHLVPRGSWRKRSRSLAAGLPLLGVLAARILASAVGPGSVCRPPGSFSSPGWGTAQRPLPPTAFHGVGSRTVVPKSEIELGPPPPPFSLPPSFSRNMANNSPALTGNSQPQHQAAAAAAQQQQQCGGGATKPAVSGKQGNVLPLWGNEKTMNLNPMILTNILSSPYFKVQLYELKTYHEVVDEIYFKD
uniref:Pre-mRNA-splicing factor 38B n=1 Tax=Castor canadensis TaxID=51338 RepID=A0A8C0XSJ2_CASCN